MQEEDNLLIKIDAYLKGHLSNEETAAFEQDIAADTALAQQVARQRVHLEALDILLEDDLRAKMKNWETEIDDKPLSSNKWKNGVLLLITFAVLLGLYFLFKPKNDMDLPNNLNKEDSLIIDKNNIDTLQTKPNPTIPTQNKSPFLNKSVLPSPTKSDAKKPIVKAQTLPNDLLETTNEDLALVLIDLENNTVRRDTQSNRLMSETYRLLKQKDYSKALNVLKNVSNTEGVFLRGITYFLNGQYLKALPIFEDLVKNDGFGRKETAEYYAALCLLANGQKQEGVQHLTKIASDNGHQYTNKAALTLKRLGY